MNGALTDYPFLVPDHRMRLLVPAGIRFRSPMSYFRLYARPKRNHVQGLER